MDYQRELAFRFPLMRGEDVMLVQLALTAIQADPPCGTPDGVYGNATRMSLMDFQRTQGLPVDGVVGPRTWIALFRAADEKRAAGSVLKRAAAALPPAGFPLSKAKALETRRWIMSHFGDRLLAGLKGSGLDAELVCAIACKETAPVWLGWTSRLAPDAVLMRCVFDASGDVPGTKRSAFPRNTAEFRDLYGSALTDDLIGEANKTRRLRGYPDAAWVYRGYGLFQYDIQHIENDREFFADKLWYQFDACLDRFKREMSDKLRASNGILADAVRRYNGSGPMAEQYRDQVLAMSEWLHTAAAEPAGALLA